MSISFPVLTIVSEARNAHGLRLQDPERYNTYCAKRILSLKKALKCISRSKKTPPKPVTEDLVASDARYLEIVLFLAERSWSQSASLKTDELYQKKKHHIARRLNRAVRHAEQLVTLLESQSISSDVTSRLEARAYKATLAGQSAFERKRWETALKEYSIAKVILEALFLKADESIRSVYKEASAAVDPGLRYCGYQLQLAAHSDIIALARTHLPQDPTLNELLKEFAPEVLEPRRNSTAAAGITSIQWRSRTANLEHPEIVVSLLKVQDSQTAYTERMAAFDLSVTERAAAMDDILNAWAEAEDAVRRIIDEGAAMNQDKEQKLQIILTYVSFHFIPTRVRRDMLLVKDLGKKRGVKMTILKDLSIQQIYELPGVAADTPLTDDLDVKQTYFRASRCILIARSHTLLKDHISALALYERAQSYISKIPSSMGSLPETDIPVTKDDIESLLTTLEGELTRSHANVIVSQPSSIETEHLNKNPLLPRLHQFPRPNSLSLTNLVEYPPKLQSVPVKPFFFDIAYNYIGLADLEEKRPEPVVQKKVEAEKKPEQAKRGWGFWR